MSARPPAGGPSDSSLLDVGFQDDGCTTTEASTRELVMKLGAVGLPSVPSLLISYSSGLVGIAFIGRLGDTNMLGAMGLCNIMFNMLGYAWVHGFTSAISTLSSQDFGAGSYHSVGITLQRAALVTLCIADLPLALVWLYSVPILEHLGQPPEVVAYVGIFTRIRLPGLLCETIRACVLRTLQSVGNTRIGAVASVATLIANVAFNALLTPWLHFEGVAIAALLYDVTGCLIYCAFASRDADFRRCWPGLSRQALHGWWPFLKLSLPSFLLMVVEEWSWTLQDFLAGLISAQALAANAVAPQIVLLQFAIGTSVGNAASTVVGNLLGQGRADEARRAARLSLILVPVCLAPSVLLLLAFRPQVASLFAQDDAVAEVVSSLLLVVEVFAIFDSHQAALTGIVAGVGKQAVVAPLIVVCYWIIGLPTGVSLAFGAFGIHALGLRGLWYGMIAAVVLHVLSFGIVVWRLDWSRAAADVRQRQAAGDHDGAPQSELSLAAS